MAACLGYTDPTTVTCTAIQHLEMTVAVLPGLKLALCTMLQTGLQPLFAGKHLRASIVLKFLSEILNPIIARLLAGRMPSSLGSFWPRTPMPQA